MTWSKFRGTGGLNSTLFTVEAFRGENIKEVKGSGGLLNENDADTGSIEWKEP